MASRAEIERLKRQRAISSPVAQTRGRRSSTQDNIPTVPDRPGGQVATVNGKKVYIAGSTMRKLGYETVEQYTTARGIRTAPSKMEKAPKGPAAGGEAAIKAVSIEYGISEAEAKRLITLMWKDPRASEFKDITNQQRLSLVAAAGGYDPWTIAPTAVAEGRIEGIAPTPIKQRVRYETQEKAISLLASKKVLDAQGRIIPQAFTLADRDRNIRQALYDVGLSGKAVSEGIKFQREHIRLSSGEYVKISEWNKMPEKYQSIALSQGIGGIEKAIKKEQLDFERGHIKLRDGKWVAIAEWNKLPESYRSIGVRQGYSAMTEYHQREIEKGSRLYTQLQAFKIKDPTVKYEQYDLAAALRKGLDDKELSNIFSPVAVKAAQEFNKKMEQEAKTETLYREELWLNVRTGKVITQAELLVITAKTPSARDEYVRQLPALILPVDPQWQTLKNRPKTDPARQAYLKKWQDKVVDTAMLAMTIATPPIFKGIGIAGKAIQIIPAGKVISRVPIHVWNNIVKTAIILTKTAFLAPAVYTASRGFDEVRAPQLQEDWQKFVKLPDAQKNIWADKAGYKPDYKVLTDEQKAVVLLHYSPPPDTTRATWEGKLQEGQATLQTQANKGSQWLNQRASSPLAITVKIAGGTVIGVLEGLGYVASIPFLVSNLAHQTPAGTAPAYARQVATGMVQFFTQVLPAAFRADPALATGRVIGLFVLSPQALIKLSKGVGARGQILTGRYIPERAMAMEYSIVRISWRRLPSSFSDKVQMRLTTLIEKQLLSGKKKAVINIADGLAIVTVKNVPYQRVFGNTLFHATPDIKTFDPTGLTTQTKLYTSPQLAMRFAVQSARGKRMTNPGVIEIRVPEKYAPNIQKVYKGTIELESVFPKGAKFEPIKGWSGKGITADVYTGSMPIQRYTIAGTSTTIKAMTPARYAQVLTMASFEAFADLFVGWHGRMRVLKEAFAKGKTKGAQPQLADWLKAEGELTRIAEFIHGRRQAISKKLNKAEIKALVEGADRYMKKTEGISEADILAGYRKVTGKSITYKRLMQDEVAFMNEAIKQSLKRTYNTYGDYIYRPDMYADRYSYWLDRLVRTVARGERAVEERPPMPELLIREYITATAKDRPRLLELPEYKYIPTQIRELYLPVEKPTERLPEEPSIRERPPEERLPRRAPPPEIPPPIPPPEIPPPRRPPLERPPAKITPLEKVPTVITRLQTQSPTSQPIPQGSIAWAQGARKGVRGIMVDQWYFIPPPFDQKKPISLSAPPLGALRTGSRKPKDTIQIVGRSRKAIPQKVDIDLGFVDITVLGGRKIVFKGGGEKTNIGTRIPSPTTGMDLDGYVGLDSFGGEPATMQGINRAKMSKVKPSRKARRTNGERINTSISGVRL